MKSPPGKLPPKTATAQNDPSVPPIPEKLVELACELQRLLDQRNSSQAKVRADEPKE